MEKSIITHESKGDVKHFDGRDVFWLQTPETTGGSYCSVCTVTYFPGARAKPAHAHDKGEETIYIVSGTGKVKVGDEIHDICAGSLVLFPQGVPHMVWNNGDEPLKLACFYAPCQDAIEYTFYEDFDFPEFL